MQIVETKKKVDALIIRVSDLFDESWVRDSMIKINEAYATQLNKGDKMHILYDYLTGNEFKLQIGAIIDGFTSLHTGYINEKKAMERKRKTIRESSA